MKSKLHIEKPCTQDWDKMKIGLQSRFCENCQKNVMDFTNKSREEIITYLQQRQGEQVCGRVYRHQLDYSNTDFLVTINALAKRHKNSNLSFYLLAMSAMMMASCGEPMNKIAASTAPLESLEYIIPEVVADNGAKGKIEKMDIDYHEIYAASQEEKDIHISNDDLLLTYYRPMHMLGDIAILPTSEYIVSGFIRSTETSILAPIENEHGQLLYTYTEKMPEFPNGLENLKGYVKNNLQYPEWEQGKGIEGVVVASYIVDEEGKVTKPEIIKSVEGAKNFDQEVIRLIKNMPNWVPGEQDGEKVACQFTLPVKFKL